MPQKYSPRKYVAFPLPFPGSGNNSKFIQMCFSNQRGHFVRLNARGGDGSRTKTKLLLSAAFVRAISRG